MQIVNQCRGSCVVDLEPTALHFTNTSNSDSHALSICNLLSQFVVDANQSFIINTAHATLPTPRSCHWYRFYPDPCATFLICCCLAPSTPDYIDTDKSQQKNHAQSIAAILASRINGWSLPPTEPANSERPSTEGIPSSPLPISWSIAAAGIDY